MRQEQHVGLGQLVLADAPGHRFDPHPASPAIHPPHAVQQHHHAAPQRHELEPALAQVIIARRRLMTARHTGLEPRRGRTVISMVWLGAQSRARSYTKPGKCW